ncbi:hypothetical protein [Bartonella sp. cb54]|uniref:hypothetical protein n=1 Tax=Bartonella sp. cb54 TaxID=3385560 RepID=UPI0039A71CE5
MRCSSSNDILDKFKNIGNAFMTRMMGCIILTLWSSVVFADKGIVIKEDVCGIGNVIIETTDGWYIAAEYYSGVYLSEGDLVYGEMKTYGFKDLYKNNGNFGRFYIENWVLDIGDALKELCK